MHDLNGMSLSQKADFSEELIGIHVKTSTAGDNKYYVIPVWKMNPNTQRNKLDPYHNIDVIVDEQMYNEYELDVRPVFISEDSADKRPFTYYGATEAFAGSNKKTFLIDLIAEPKIGYTAIVKNGDNNNLKLSNINVIPTNNTNNPLDKLDKRKHVQQPLSIPLNGDDKSFLPKLPIVEDRTIEQLVSDGEIITSKDAVRDKTFKWFGVSKISGKEKWTATCKSKHLGTFGHPVDAARAYNDYVIDNGLPYVVNNIPGFLKGKFVDLHNEFKLASVETHKLAEMIVLRTTPGLTDQ